MLILARTSINLLAGDSLPTLFCLNIKLEQVSLSVVCTVQTIIIIGPGSFNVLGDQLNQRLKKVFETEAEAAEPNIYKGKSRRESKTSSDYISKIRNS